MKKWLLITLVLTLLLSAANLISCNSDDNGTDATGQTGNTDNTNSEDIGSSGELPWDNIPVYPGATLETTESCPVQWEECEVCERRVYVTDDLPADICPFYEQNMPARGWDELVYQMWPEGSCTGTWMADMGDSSGPRVLMGIGQESRDDNRTVIIITMGVGCP